MHARTTELLEHLERHRGTLLAALANVPAHLHAVKPAPDRWCVAEVAEHLWITETRLGELLGAALTAALAKAPLPPEPDASSIVATIDAAALLDRERRVAARAPVQPRGATTVPAAIAGLAASRTALLRHVQRADGLDTRSVCAPHPYFGDLTFHQWIAFVGLHEARHAAQIVATAAAVAR